jgi:L-iditol 2-dehydrogenase
MTQTMQALVVREPNVLEIAEKPIPEPGADEVLARVRSTSICGTDAHLIRGDYPGFWPPAFPFTPGHEWAGEIVALGPGAEAFGWAVGDRVAGTSHNASRGATTSARTTASRGCTPSTGTTRRAWTPPTPSTT